jgi:aminoglycoside phosphotransferase (APT) family kinase protein
LTGEQLAAVLRPVLGEVSIENLRALTGGASRTTWAFDAVGAAHARSGESGQRRALILRTGPPDDVHAGMELEAAVQQRAAAAGAPVPHILAADNSPAALGNPYLICDAISGETIVRRIHRALDEPARARALQQCAQALAAIHRADPDGVGLDDVDQLTEWRQRLDDMGDTTATFEWAFRWLDGHRPAPSSPRLVHGDFRMGNLIVDESGLAAVLDWELVHIGEVYEDLAWFCIRAWRFGAPEHLGAGGLGSVDSFLSAYEAASGESIDREMFRWWLTLATLRWGVICRFQAERHLSGHTKSVELAAIGRRVSETEWDVLDLLENGGPERSLPFEKSQKSRTVRNVRRGEVNWLYGRPTAAELVAAVADFLDNDVRSSTGPDGRLADAGQVNFHARVAANVLRIVERELTDDSAAEVTGRLAELGFADEAQLAAAIRAGTLDDRADDVLPVLRTLVRHRLAIAHPGYDESGPDSS